MSQKRNTSPFGWLFILNALLEINDGLGQAALHSTQCCTTELTDGLWLCVFSCFAV
jgi:hypothetical protein